MTRSAHKRTCRCGRELEPHHAACCMTCWQRGEGHTEGCDAIEARLATEQGQGQ